MKTILNKATFSKIKRMGYGEMSAFLNSVYRQAHEDGQSEGLTVGEVKDILIDEGIEEEKAERIIHRLGDKMEVENNRVYQCGNCGKDLSRYKAAKYCLFCGAELEWEHD